jgi:F-type H+-transporting ATPase subunit a
VSAEAAAIGAGGPGVAAGGGGNDRKRGMSKGRKIFWGVLVGYLVGAIGLAVAYGIKGHKNEGFKVIDSFHLDTWASIGPIDLNKGVLYVVITGLLTIGLLLWVSRRMEKRPGRTQVVVEWMYDLMQRTTRDTMDEDMTRKWFPLVFTIFVFILITNLIGYIPLPINSAQTFRVAGVSVPSFQIYAADTNVAIPLLLALGVFITFNTVGIKAQGFRGYIKSLIPSGVGGAMLIFIYPLEIVSVFLRLLSLTIRLWANLLAGHLLIEFMAGDLAVLLGLQLLGWITLPIGVAIFIFEAVLIAGLQAFIFAILTAIYIGGAVSRH